MSSTTSTSSSSDHLPSATDAIGSRNNNNNNNNSNRMPAAMLHNFHTQHQLQMNDLLSMYGGPGMMGGAVAGSRVGGGMNYNNDDDEDYEEGEGDQTYDNDNKKAKVYDDYQDVHGVRRPDKVKTQRLVDHSPRELFNIRQNALGLNRADPPDVEWLFPPPRQLSYPETFEDTKLFAKSDKKWLLVNIQNHKEFSSHMLNRDTWSNEVSE
jgi:hypothetical protein